MHFVSTVMPDIPFGVHIIAQFIHKASRSLCAARKHILRYLKGKMSLGTIYHYEDGNGLEVFLRQIGGMTNSLENQSVDIHSCVQEAQSRGGRNNNQQLHKGQKRPMTLPLQIV